MSKGTFHYDIYVTTPLCQLTIIIVSIILNLGRACFLKKEIVLAVNTLSLPRSGVTMGDPARISG